MSATGPVLPHQPNCFVCGPGNPCTTHARFVRDGERVHATLRLDERHEGAPGFVHGGALAAVLDDTLGSLLGILKRPAVTARLEVDYRKRAFVPADYTAEAWVDGIDGRKLHLSALIRDSDGDVVAEARSLFVEVPATSSRGSSRTDSVRACVRWPVSPSWRLFGRGSIL